MNDQSNSAEMWNQHLERLVSLMDYYDREIELCADYRPREIIRPENVFDAIARIPDENIAPQNVKMIIAARELVKQCREEDFQRRY